MSCLSSQVFDSGTADFQDVIHRFDIAAGEVLSIREVCLSDLCCGIKVGFHYPPEHKLMTCHL